MSGELRPIRFTVEVFYDHETRRWDFDGEVDGEGMVGSGGTREQAVRRAADAIVFARHARQSDRSLPADPVAPPVVAASWAVTTGSAERPAPATVRSSLAHVTEHHETR